MARQGIWQAISSTDVRSSNRSPNPRPAKYLARSGGRVCSQVCVEGLSIAVASSLLWAMVNHSLATAKAYWEKLQTASGHGPLTRAVTPCGSREYLHDEALVFETDSTPACCSDDT